MRPVVRIGSFPAHHTAQWGRLSYPLGVKRARIDRCLLGLSEVRVSILQAIRGSLRDRMIRLPTVLAVCALLPVVAAAEPPPVEPVVTDADVADERPERDPYDPKFIAVPIVGYTPSTSVAFAGIGMVQFRPPSCTADSRSSSVAFAASYTLRSQWLAGVEPSVYLDDGRIWVESRVFVLDWHTDFYGIGPDSRLADEEEYVPRRFSADAAFRHVLGDPRLYAGIGYAFRLTAIRATDPDGTLVSDEPIGFDGGTLTGPMLGLSWDSRDNQFFPHSGTLVKADLELSHRGLGADFNRTIGTIDARGYLDVGVRANHILAGRAQAELSTGDVPFYALPTLGGSGNMRGMSSGRLRDVNAMSLELEYRTPLVGRFGFVTFAGLGDVFRRFSEIQASPRWTAGGGVRVRVDRDNRVNVRLDYGVSREEFSGFYLSVTEAF